MVRDYLLFCMSLVLGLIFLPAGTMGVSIPMEDPTFITYDDMIGWNWRVLVEAGQIDEAPALPTGQTAWIRMYSNGSPQETPNAPGTTPLIPPVIAPNDVGGDVGPSAEWWYGLDWEGNDIAPNLNPNTGVARVLTTDEVLNAIRTMDNNPNVVSPVFAFDQNQVGEQLKDPEDLPAGWPDPSVLPVYDRDKWLRGRLILVPPGYGGMSGLEWFLDKTAADIKAEFDSMVVPPPDDNPFIPGVDDSGVVTFYFRDTFFNDFPDQNNPDENWAYLPGVYDPRLVPELDIPDDYFPAGADLPVDNNVGGAVADWGGYFPNLDLTQYEGYAFLVSLESKFNNNGRPEAYIIGGTTGVIPEPVTMMGVFLGLGGVACYLRRR